MAEYIMKDLIDRNGLKDEIAVASAATSAEEIGNDVYPPAQKVLAENSIPCPHRQARQMTRADYDSYDMLIGMNSANIADMMRIAGGDPLGKISRLRDHSDKGGDIADPWYTRDFKTAFNQIKEGCEGLFKEITSNNQRSKATSNI